MVNKDRGFQFAANAIMMLIALCAVIPFILLFMSSITDEAVLLTNGYSFFPAKISFYAYEYLFKDTGSLLNAYRISFLVTALGTAGSLLLTVLFAYPLSCRTLPGRGLFSFFLFFTMLFNGGLVPSYIMWTQTFHIRNTIWALMIPDLLLGAFNVIMMRTYFTTNIPDSVIEAARIEGANEFRILGEVVLPMALPITATVGILVGLNYWNNWTNGLYYITNTRLYSLQQYLKSIIDNVQALATMDIGFAGEVPSISIRMAIAVVGTVPILVLYPFFQKAFVAGIALGGVKE